MVEILSSHVLVNVNLCNIRRDGESLAVTSTINSSSCELPFLQVTLEDRVINRRVGHDHGSKYSSTGTRGSGKELFVYVNHMQLGSGKSTINGMFGREMDVSVEMVLCSSGDGILGDVKVGLIASTGSVSQLDSVVGDREVHVGNGTITKMKFIVSIVSAVHGAQGNWRVLGTGTLGSVHVLPKFRMIIVEGRISGTGLLDC
mmetsp:Transcript_12850/g.19267  ORF Transcript_12850/g.19267 Transcript_12850/m.19267 type:complete len:202 (+) Transcript_12850:536-1141(+)